MDRAPEEKAVGITINAPTVEYETGRPMKLTLKSISNKEL